MKSKDYDINLYVVDGVVRLSAYELKYLDDPKNRVPNETNHDKFTTLEIPMTMEHFGEVAYLLNDPKWHTAADDEVYRLVDTDNPTDLERRAVAIDKWQDYDSWEGGEDWYNGLPTQRLKDWVDGLPEYEPEPSHEWERSTEEVFAELRRATEFPTYVTTKCRNCDETYRVGKEW